MVKIETVKVVGGKVVRTVEEVELSPETGRVVKFKRGKKKGKESRLLRQKLLKSPKVKIKGLSAERALAGLAASQRVPQTQSPLPVEIEVPEQVQQSRNLFFRDEFLKERREGIKFLS